MHHSIRSATVAVQENRQKAAKMLISVVVIFALCYLPVHVFNLFRYPIESARLCCLLELCLIRYIYVYLEHAHRPRLEPSLNQTDPCFTPRPVSLERAGAAEIVTISALISHFLPYFNSSINPIIYNIMSGKFSSSLSSSPFVSIGWLDKFRLKFRELFARCCCQNMDRSKSNSSTMIPFKSTSLIQPSPLSINAPRRPSRLGGNTLTVNVDESRLLVNHPTRSHPPSSSSSSPLNLLPKTRNGSICFRLTNVWHDSMKTSTVIVR